MVALLGRLHCWFPPVKEIVRERSSLARASNGPERARPGRRENPAPGHPIAGGPVRSVRSDRKLGVARTRRALPLRGRAPLRRVTRPPGRPAPRQLNNTIPGQRDRAPARNPAVCRMSTPPFKEIRGRPRRSWLIDQTGRRLVRTRGWRRIACRRPRACDFLTERKRTISGRRAAGV